MVPPTGVQFNRIALDCYKNINDYYPQTDRLYGTETMCGDWKGSLLLLAQDFCHTGLIETRLQSFRGRNPFYHDEDFATNQSLVRLLSPHFDVQINGENARNCGVLYGSAIWLLKVGSIASARLPCRVSAMNACRPVLEATITGMGPTLEKIFCLGLLAYQAVAQIYGQFNTNWRRDLDAHRTIDVDGVLICPLPHPGRLGTRNRGGWTIVQDDFDRYLRL